MAKFSPLTTERCTLEDFTERHLTQRYLSWLQDFEVIQFSEQRHKQHDIESCRTYMHSFTGTPNYFVAIVAQDSELGHIGNINAYIDENNGVADVGILLGEKRIWGQGYGAEAWEAMCRFLLLTRKLRKVTAGTSSTNVGMRGIMRRTGMIEDGVRKRQLLMNGDEIDVVYAALFRENL